MQTRGYASQAMPQAPRQLEGIAGKYATAAYVSALSKGDKTLTKVESDLKTFDSSLRGDSADAAKLRTFLENPTLSLADKAKAISDLLQAQKGGADEITRNLFETLAENGRLGETNKVISGFFQLMAAFRGEVEAVVTSAKVRCPRPMRIGLTPISRWTSRPPPASRPRSRAPSTPPPRAPSRSRCPTR